MKERQSSTAHKHQQKKEFGGALLIGKRRSKRPLHFKKCLHLVMRSDLARGPYSMRLYKNFLLVDAIIERQAKIHRVKIHKFANAGNHLHMICHPPSRGAYVRFVRAVSGLIARKILKVKRGVSRGLKFWSLRPYTRIVEWGRDFKNVVRYVLMNEFETAGVTHLLPRRKIGESPPVDYIFVET